MEQNSTEDISFLNPNAMHYYRSALKWRIPVTLLPEIRGFEFRLGKHRYFSRGSESFFNGFYGVLIARDKYAANRILARAGIPVPKAVAFEENYLQHETLEEILADIQFPVVIKPTNDSSKGQDVLCNIASMDALKGYLPGFFLKHSFVSIEEFHGNLTSYRILVFKEKIIGVVQRDPASVVGDGLHTLRELIDLTNIKRQQTNDVLAPIVVDDELLIRLDELQLTLEYVPQRNEKVTLCYVCNATRGGSYRSLPLKVVSKENKKLFIQVARALNLKLVGIDVQCKNLQLPIVSSGGVIIEANAGPSIRIHHEAYDGVAYQVTDKIVRGLIYRHPFSYFRSLLGNRWPYIRNVMVFSLLGVVVKLWDVLL